MRLCFSAGFGLGLRAGGDHRGPQDVHSQIVQGNMAVEICSVGIANYCRTGRLFNRLGQKIRLFFFFGMEYRKYYVGR